jgi:hypothetical protein
VRRFENLDSAGLAALRDLGRRAREKRLWVIAAARLLRYAEAHRAVRFTAEDRDGATVIRLAADPLPDGRVLTAEDLAGLSFGVPDPARVELRYADRPVAVEPVPGEPGAVWVPLTPLEFPDPPRGSRG